MARNTKKSKSGFGFILWLLLAFVVWFFASPFFFLYNLRQDALKGDKAALSEKVDFQEIRLSLKSQVSNRYSQKSDQSNDPISGLKNAIAPKIANSLIDKVVTPSGISRLVKSGKLEGAEEKSDKKPKEQPAIGMNWQGPNNVTIELKTNKEGKESKVGLMLERRNLISWKMVGIALPMEDMIK